MHIYNLKIYIREDLDSLNEVSLWPGQRNSLQTVDSKVN